jgi:hypothetical protein
MFALFRFPCAVYKYRNTRSSPLSKGYQMPLQIILPGPNYINLYVMKINLYFLRTDSTDYILNEVAGRSGW